jgi:hypothetical protein
MVTQSLQGCAGERWRNINTALQRGDSRFHHSITALAVFPPDRKTAEAVRTRMKVDNHLAEARC